MEKPKILIWIQIVSIFFLFSTIFLLFFGAPVYLLAMALGGAPTIYLGFFIILFLVIALIMQVISWTKIVRKSTNAYLFLKISWISLFISVFFMIYAFMLLANESEIVFLPFLIIVFLTYQLFNSENIITYFRSQQNDDKEEKNIIH